MAISLASFWNATVSASVTFIFPGELSHWCSAGTFPGYALMAAVDTQYLWTGSRPAIRSLEIEGSTALNASKITLTRRNVRLPRIDTALAGIQSITIVIMEWAGLLVLVALPPNWRLKDSA